VSDRLLGPIERYYTAKFEEHGPVPHGVDWNSDESQERRFAQLLRVTLPGRTFSLNDYGCGYGALALYLDRIGYDVDYRGFDISARMREAARQIVSDGAKIVDGPEGLQTADFTVASGVFNVRLGTADDAWLKYVLETLDQLDALSQRGFAFNALTSYSDPERMRADLYYADPAVLFDLCKRRYSRHVALLPDYGLYEFTILVRREPTA
jgi:SAM-dependent methyltransferase